MESAVETGRIKLHLNTREASINRNDVANIDCRYVKVIRICGVKFIWEVPEGAFVFTDGENVMGGPIS